MAVGGDYYDLKQIDGHRVAALLADVCGHGMSAAFITGLIKTTFEFSHLADRPTNEFIAEVNQVIEQLTPPESFAAVIFAIYDVNDRTLCYTNAGHSPVPMIVRAGNCEVESLYDAAGMIAGVTAGEPYEEGKVLLAPGDKMVLCTDGLTDAENRQEVRFGRERLLALLRQHAKLPALGLCEQIMQEIARHTDDAVQTDDRALLIMEVLN
jgi:sigma-B regulation protein RsbU (phosphoserine phosphatase)